MESDTSATKTGLSAARLARMHDTLLRHVAQGRMPGLVAVIGRRGAEHVDAIGTLAFDRSAPAVLALANLDPRRRAETLQLTELARLAELFSSVKKPPVL